MANEMSAGGQGEDTAPEGVVVSNPNTVRVVGFAAPPKPLAGVGDRGTHTAASESPPATGPRGAFPKGQVGPDAHE